MTWAHNFPKKMPFLPLARSMCHVSPHAANKTPISDHSAPAILYSKFNMCAIRQSDENPKTIEPSQIHKHGVLVPPQFLKHSLVLAQAFFLACYTWPKSYIENLKVQKSTVFWDFPKSEFHKNLRKVARFLYVVKPIYS